MRFDGTHPIPRFYDSGFRIKGVPRMVKFLADHQDKLGSKDQESNINDRSNLDVERDLNIK